MFFNCPGNPEYTDIRIVKFNNFAQIPLAPKITHKVKARLTSKLDAAIIL